jgi:hypothetical protein
MLCGAKIEISITFVTEGNLILLRKKSYQMHNKSTIICFSVPLINKKKLPEDSFQFFLSLLLSTHFENLFATSLQFTTFQNAVT